ncbi:UDP-N-acetylmuramoyl-tripeptide--D-alanyl-D-alanine ligase [Olsenella sp. An290]|uniref:UDP-N-acetylmuramoyl-tripeptide--D-alanyl-D- alanine ligase n=1 Tax=Olsenella sp. An290 TaxID=1965625 RepID=UPI000B3982F8|nr:UDP-N-acetylmuramoyl-tripeptide--D-alanyl-D-alanine ligase [Olsenella sp. An290]OUO34625.1 UDP-N-acetylmuramoylalanyl-D-glutamyl-2, 6-diaminopimelate--D-alanyl-D-alanine ligase [Olsenella sp. An290]
MIRMSIAELARATGAAVLVEGARGVEGEVVIDSREAGPGCLFIAFAGERVDGNAYLAPAARAGAAAVVATAEVPAEALEAAHAAGCAVLRAEGDDGEEFMLRLAGAWRALHPDWLVLAVTGSVGKTTTKEMLAAGVGATRRCHATRGNFNNLIGLPLTVLSAPEDAEVLVCELGMNHLHEIERMSRACRPALAAITNVGTSHIGILGSRENIARAKAEVVSGLVAHDGVGPALALASSGDFTPFIAERFCAPAGVEVLPVGTGAGDLVRAGEVTLDACGRARLTVSCADGWSREVRLSLPGAKIVDDLLLALALIWRAGLDRDAAVGAIERMEATSMRLDVRTAASGARVIDDSYNAAPASMASSLDVLCSMDCAGRRIAVLGEMGELGDEAARLHGYVGAYAAAKGVDLLVLIGGELAAEVAEAARTMGLSEDAIESFPTVDDAARVIGPVLSDGDLVLVKASRAAGLDAFVKGVLAL